jgi:hypothetical protein
VVVGAVTFLACLAVFSFTTSRLIGYEPETAAVTKGFVTTGELQIPEGSAPISEAPEGRGDSGPRYGRSTLPQQLLEVPFFAPCLLPVQLECRQFLIFFNPLMGALAGLAIFGIMALRLGSLRWSVALAAAFAVGSIAWPYSKIGMETTFMALAAATLAVLLLAMRVDRYLVWVLAGVVAGAAATAKAYALVVIAPSFLLVLAEARGWSRRKQWRVATAVMLPVLVWLVAQAWYNWYRTGSVLSFGSAEKYFPTLAAPLNFLGFFFSPGKSIFIYSPLVLLGLLGLKQMWERDRVFAVTIAAGFLGLTAVVSGSAHWSDETWGPRYLVPVAWLLLLPLPWWYRRSQRRKLFATIAVLAVGIQLLAVFVPNSAFINLYRGLTGASPFYAGQVTTNPVEWTAPFGRDPYRWVPQLSPVLLRAQAAAAVGTERLTGNRLRVTYEPFLGRSRSLLLPFRRGGTMGIPDTWWWRQEGLGPKLTAGALGTVAIALWLWLARVMRGNFPRPALADHNNSPAGRPADC